MDFILPGSSDMTFFPLRREGGMTMIAPRDAREQDRGTRFAHVG
jgi:hypothetical protein